MKRAFHGALTWLLVTCEIMSDWDSPLISHLTRHTQTRWYTDTYCRPLTSNVYGRVCVLFIDILDAVVRMETKISCLHNCAKYRKMTTFWLFLNFISKRQHLKQRDHFFIKILMTWDFCRFAQKYLFSYKYLKNFITKRQHLSATCET
jgi:hypothetical protein